MVLITLACAYEHYGIAGESQRRCGGFGRYQTIPNYSLRVEIALWEDDLDAAWTAVHAGVCNRGLLLTLADKLAPTRADDALSLYKQVIPLIVEETNNTAYADAVKLIRKVERIMNVQQHHCEFGDFLAELRAAPS